MRRLLVLGLLVGCYSPHPETGARCGAMGECPYGLVCSAATQTCELTDGDAGVMDVVQVTSDACVPSPEICGDGIDQDCDGVDPACPANDLPSGAIDVTAGGTFTVDLSAAHDDAAPGGGGPGAPCGGTGGRDVFYEVTITADEIYYFDTFGSDFDSVIRVYHTACASGAAPPGTFCRDDNCGVTQSQLATRLVAGTNCIVIDQKTGAETAGDMVLHVERGHRDGQKFSSGSTVTDNTCTDGTADAAGTCSGAAQDIGYYMTECPGDTGSLTATTCDVATLYDSALIVLGPTTTQLACNGGDAACAEATGATVTDVQLPGAHLFWLIVTGRLAADCGAYSLTATLN